MVKTAMGLCGFAHFLHAEKQRKEPISQLALSFACQYFAQLLTCSDFHELIMANVVIGHYATNLYFVPYFVLILSLYCLIILFHDAFS